MLCASRRLVLAGNQAMETKLEACSNSQDMRAPFCRARLSSPAVDEAALKLIYIDAVVSVVAIIIVIIIVPTSAYRFAPFA